VEIFVLLMGNLFNTSRIVHEKYDLKGSWVARSVKEHIQDPSKLGKDMDLEREIKVGPNQKEKLLKQLSKDTKFLADQGIMDYSLLVGFSFLTNEVDIPPTKQTNELINSFDDGILSTDKSEVYFIGLIDILQRYNFQKKMERYMKIYCLRADKDGLSVQPVDVYNYRFLKRMDQVMK